VQATARRDVGFASKDSDGGVFNIHQFEEFLIDTFFGRLLSAEDFSRAIFG
jgi:hypothetical protein